MWEENCKVTVMEWLNDTELILGCDDGSIYLADINNSDFIVQKYEFHSSTVKSLCFNRDMTELLTASSDCTSKIISIISNPWEVKKVLDSSSPINCAVYSNNYRKILLGGGAEAMLVAKTSVNDLNLKIYNIKTSKFTTHISNHFGPIRYISHSKNSRNFTTASQDGTVKIYVHQDAGIREVSTEGIPAEFEETKFLRNSTGIQEEVHLPNPGVSTEPTPTELLSKYLPFGIACDKPISELLLKDEAVKIDLLHLKGKNKVVEKTNFVVGMNNPGSNYDEDALFTFKSRDREEEYVIEDINKDNFTIRVTNLPNDVELRDLWETFEYFGRIEEKGVKLKYFQSDTVAFIAYTHKDCSDKAINAMHGKSMGYNIIHVDYAKSTRI